MDELGGVLLEVHPMDAHLAALRRRRRLVALGDDGPREVGVK
jgi:hypothetical protein